MLLSLRSDDCDSSAIPLEPEASIKSESEPRAITFVRVPPYEPERTPAYEEWYDGTHIPLRMTMPGFLGALRYDCILGRQRYLVMYELESASAPESQEYVELRRWESQQPPDSFEAPGLTRAGFERGIYDQVAGTDWPEASLLSPFVHIAGFSPPSRSLAEAEAWLREVHNPRLAELPGVKAVRTFVRTRRTFGAGTGLISHHPEIMTISYLDSASVMSAHLFTAAQADSRRSENTEDQEPYVVAGRLVFSAIGSGQQRLDDAGRSLTKNRSGA
jgi:hypothetical protein